MMLLFTFVVSILLCIVSIRRYKKIFNPFSLEVYFSILFLIIPQLILVYIDPLSKTYFYSDLVILVYIVSIYLGTLINIRVFRIKEIENKKIVSALTLLLFLILILPLVFYFRKFDISVRGIRDFYESVVFSEYASFFELSRYLLYFLIIGRLVRTNNFDFLTAALSVFILFYGSKFALLDFIIIIFIFFEQFKRLPFRKFVLWGVISGAVMISYRFYQSNGKEDAFQTAITYFDLYKNQSMLVKKLVDENYDYYYGRIFITSYLKYIPRAIWTSKPREFGFAIINYDFFPESAKKGYMPAFGLATIFADFGFVSIVCFGFTAGLLRHTLYRIFLQSKNSVTFVLYALPLNFITILFLGMRSIFDHLVHQTRERNNTLD